MRSARFMAVLLAQAALGCDGVSTLPVPPETPASYVVSCPYDAVDEAYAAAIDAVSSMVFDEATRRYALRRGLDVVNVAWEDTGRAQGSALGPNISDLTLQVRRRSGPGSFADSLMPVVRYPNFTDRTGDVPADKLFVRVGNERGAQLASVPVAELLKDLRRFASSPDTLGGNEAEVAPLDVSAERDTHYLVSAQAVFLPIPRSGKAEFNPVLFNYQSAPESPAVLAILATREGTSVAVIENRASDALAYGAGQELYFNDQGQRAAFTAERRGEVAARIAAQGGPRTQADRSALGKGADVLVIIQVPLMHQDRGLLGGPLPSPGDGYGYEFSDDPLASGGFGPNDATIRVRPGPVGIGGDVERAVLGHGPRLGPYAEGYGTRLVRDKRFPVRITVQFYKATSDGIATEKDFDAIERNIESAYEHAEFIGSLVLPEDDARRPTAWQSIPDEWFPW